MKLRGGRVALDGVQLDELDPSIVIRSIDPGTTQENVTTANMMGGAGTRITGEHWTTLEATVVYAIDIPKTQLQERRRVFDLVNDWAAQKGWLTVSWMKGKRMQVDKVVFPSSGFLWEWTAEFTLVFRGYNVPFWRDSTSTTAKSKTTSGGSVSIELGGQVTTTLAATFENKSGKQIDNITITVKSGSTQVSRMVFANLALGGSDSLVIDHNHGVLRIRKKSGNTYTSAYAKFTGSDDLWAEPGESTVEFTADRAVVLTVSGVGRYV